MLLLYNAYTPAASGAYQIARSLRFNSADSAYLNRTFGTPTNQHKWTLSVWLKRANIGTSMVIFGAASGTYPCVTLGLNAGAGNEDAISLTDNVPNSDLNTSAKFRDPSAWLHIVVAVDTTQATAANRVHIYANNVEGSYAETTYPAQNQSWAINTAVSHYIGQYGGGSSYFDGYMAEMYFIDGQQLTPSSFGETNTTTGVWDPKAYAGSFGNNGFWLSFANNASTTTLGYDDAGGAAGAGAGANDWTLTNFSVSAGVGNDSLTDTPTNYGTDTGAGGEVRGDYATFDALWPSPRATLSNGNLDMGGGNGANFATARATQPITAPTYWETVVPAAVTNAYHGLIDIKNNPLFNYGSAIGYDSSGYPKSASIHPNDGKIFYNSATPIATYGSASAGAILNHAYDPSTGKYWAGINGTWQNSGNPAAGTGNVATLDTTLTYAPAISDAAAQTVSINFGQRPFAYAAPTGFKALCTQNLTNTTVALPSTFTGNASADGPYVWANGIVNSVTINGNVATEGTHFRKVAGGIKLITSSSSYNQSGSNTVSAATYGTAFKYARAT